MNQRLNPIYLLLSICCAILFILAMQDGIVDSVGILILFAIQFVLVSLLSKGYYWPKWVCLVIFGFFAIGSFSEAIDSSETFIYATATIYSGLFVLTLAIRKEHVKSAVSKNHFENNIELNKVTQETVQAKIEGNSFPYLSTRIKAVLIDTSLLMVFMMIIMGISSNFPELSTSIKVTCLSLCLLYDPFLTAYSTTIGQRVMQIRVRSIEDTNQRINIFQAIIRSVVKISFGWVSFLTIHANPERRAMHDLASASVVIKY